jgi:hypothetical protein
VATAGGVVPLVQHKPGRPAARHIHVSQQQRATACK